MLITCGCSKNLAELQIKDNLNFIYGEDIYYDELIKINNGTLLNTGKINYTDVGYQEINIDYIDIKKHKGSIKVNINIIDNEPPLLSLSSNMYSIVNNDIDICSNAFYGDNADRNPKCIIEGVYDIDTIGIYDLIVKVIDNSGNETTKNIKLHIVEELNNNSNTTNNKVDKLDEMIMKYKTNRTMIGIDVSSYQGDIDWQTVKNSGVEFAIIRIGFGHNSEGKIVLDNKALNNLNNAKEVGIKIGGYFYSYATELWEAREQADFIIENLKGINLDLPIAFDFEDWSNFKNYNINFYDINNVAKEFMNVLKANGYEIMNYGSKYYLNNIWDTTNYKTWLAHYIYNTDYDKDYYIWQFSNTGEVPGIRGNVDLNVLYLD